MITILIPALSSYAGNGDDTDRFGRNREDKVTSGGLMLTADLSGLMINNVNSFSSSPRMGIGIGGFVDFKVVRRMVIEAGLSFGYDHIGLRNPESTGVMENWSMTVPILFMAKLPVKGGSSGTFYIGGGPYTEFILGCRTELGGETFNPYEQVVDQDENGDDIFALSNSNSGLAAKFIYELPCHFQIFLAQYFSLSDIIGYNHDSGGIHPYKTQLGIAYRFR